MQLNKNQGDWEYGNKETMLRVKGMLEHYFCLFNMSSLVRASVSSVRLGGGMVCNRECVYRCLSS